SASRWRKAFAKGVAADARRRGLAEPRWSKPAKAVLVVTALAPAILLATAVTSLPTHNGTSRAGTSDSGSTWFAIAVVAWVMLLALIGAYRADRPSQAGTAAWGRWLGLREYLSRDENFVAAPPAAVAIQPSRWSPGVRLGVAIGIAVAGLGLTYALIAWARLFAGGVGDLFFRDSVRGQIVRVRHRRDRYFVAVDDGAHDQVRAWAVK